MIVPPEGTSVPAFGRTTRTTSFCFLVWCGSRIVTLKQWAFLRAASLAAIVLPTILGTTQLAAEAGVAGTVWMIVCVGSVT